jgi:hypothetical protein
MAPDTFITLIFIAGLLAGSGITILVILTPDAARALRRLARQARRRRAARA